MGHEDNTLNKIGPAPLPSGNPSGPLVDSKSDDESKDDIELKKNESELKQDIPLKQNVTAGLKTFGPKFWDHGDRYTIPIAQLKNYKGVRDELKEIKRIARKRYRAKQKRLKEANKTWPSYFKLLVTRRTIPSMRKEVRSLNDLKEAAKACDAPLAAYEDAAKLLRTLRQRPIPRDETKRNQFFDQLKQAATAVKSTGKELEKALVSLGDQAGKRKRRIRWSRSWLRAPFRNTSRYKHVDDILIRLLSVTKHMLLTQDGYQNSIVQQMETEIDRIGELKRRIDKAASDDSGQDALDNVLGRADDRARLRASVALQALRCGEPLSPRLKHALTKQAVVGTPTYLDRGFFNEVYKAKLRLPGPDGTDIVSDYALKPLDARIKLAVHAGSLIGLADRQVGVFARHCAANEISKAMGMDLVGKPEIIELEGRLYMALPLVKGYDTWEFGDTMEMVGGTRLYNKVAEALHKNPNFQNACKEIQLFNVLTSDPDSHGCNVKFRFIDPVTRQDVSPLQMAEMEPTYISKLQIKAGLFDQDLTFAPMGSIRQEYLNPKYKYPKRWRYLGPPPFHTNVDRERTDKLLTNLRSGPLSREMRWHLINGGSKDHDEFAALKTRTAALKRHMDEDTRHRLDADTGEYLHSQTSEPYGKTDWRRFMSDHAPEVKHGPNPEPDWEDVETISASAVHKYMRLKETG